MVPPVGRDEVKEWSARTAPSLPLWAAIFFLGSARQLLYLITDLRASVGIAVPTAGTWIGRDFTNFWIGPQLALEGVNVYDNAAYIDGLRELGIQQGQNYSYPPATLLFETPLSFLPYPVALGLWVGGGLVAFYCAARPFIRFSP